MSGMTGIVGDRTAFEGRFTSIVEGCREGEVAYEECDEDDPRQEAGRRKDALHGDTMPLTEAPVNQVVKDVYCPTCAKKGLSRYIGAFVGKGQCASCKTWVKVDSSYRTG